MNDRSIAISILQKARDALSERLTQRVIEAQADIEADAEGSSYLSEIETIYEQIGGRLAHLNAMLSNLPPSAAAPVPEATASEIIYADLATAYPSGLDLENTTNSTLLGLPAPPHPDPPAVEPLVELLRGIAVHAIEGDLITAARMTSELFDIRPSQARRGVQSLVHQAGERPELVEQLIELGSSLEATNEYVAATLLGEVFEFQAIEALSMVRALKSRLADPDAAR
jgi:hypothetical protein